MQVNRRSTSGPATDCLGRCRIPGVDLGVRRLRVGCGEASGLRDRHGHELPIVRLLGHIAPDELVAVARHGANEPRLPRVVAQGAAQRADRLRQRAVRDDHVAPDVGEDRLLRDGFLAVADEQQQQIEILRDQGHRPAAAQEDALARGQHERFEPVPDGWGHGRDALWYPAAPMPAGAGVRGQGRIIAA